MMKQSPFYFDKEIHSEELMVTAHPNTILDKKTGEWVAVPEDQAIKDSPKNFILKKNAKGEVEEVVDNDKEIFNGPYREKPIARSIMTDELQVAIANNWADSGGDPLGQLWEQLRPLAPYADIAANALGSMANAIKGYSSKQEDPGGFESFIKKVLLPMITSAGKVTKSGAGYLQRSLVTQGTRHSYYSGTGIDFNGNFGMKYTLFADWLWDDGEKKFKFKTVYDQLEEILPYIIGKLEPFDASFLDEAAKGNGINLQTKWEGINDGVNKLTKAGADTTQHVLSKYVWWQFAPAGFESNLKYIDGVQKGTFKLRVGAFYSIENLVISSAQFHLSKNLTKYPDEAWDGDRSTISSTERNRLTPMSCEVTLQFKPATKYSINSFKRYMSGKASRQYMSSYEMNLKNHLKKLKDSESLMIRDSLVGDTDWELKGTNRAEASMSDILKSLGK